MNDIFELYQSLQLTPEQKDAAHARDEALARQAGRDGVYRRFEELAGTVTWSISWQALRMEE
jgi:hypothetical protein